MSGNGIVDEIDATLARLHFVGATPTQPFDPARCNVVGPSDGGVSDCRLEDIFALLRALKGESETLGDACAAYRAP